MFDSCRNCLFDTTVTPAVIYFEIFVVFSVGLLLILLSVFRKNIIKKFFIISIGVLIFEVFTSPMWHNYHLGGWAYMYKDVSWILTIGWSIMILSVVEIIDYLFSNKKEYFRTFLSVLVLLPIVIFFESLIIFIGVRSYSPEVMEIIAGHTIPYMNVPWHILYYVPVFIILIIGFYKYFRFLIDKITLIPVNKSKLVRNGLFAFFAVILFEIMVEPMVINKGFPDFLNIYRDVNLGMSIIWVLIIWFVTTIVDRYFIEKGIVERFFYYLLFIAVVAIPIEALFVWSGVRVYGESASSNFSGVVSPISSTPVEILFAIPFYFALVIGLLRYLEAVSDNNL
jgi:hypothetical protein